jgi:hypothetical protein
MASFFVDTFIVKARVPLIAIAAATVQVMASSVDTVQQTVPVKYNKMRSTLNFEFAYCCYISLDRRYPKAILKGKSIRPLQ